MSAAAAGGRRIAIKSILCRDIKSFVPFQKPPLHAAVSLAGRREKTPADPDGGENPEWENTTIVFDLDAAAGDGEQQQRTPLLQFEVKAQVPLLGHKLVGTACVPTADLDEPPSGGPPWHVSYQVRAPDGKPNGTLTFSYVISCAHQPEQAPGACHAPLPPPLTAAFPGPAMASSAPPQLPPPVSASLNPALQESMPRSYAPPPPVSASLNAALQDSMPRSYAPPPPPSFMNSPFPTQNPTPNLPPTVSYPPPPVSSTACSSYPPQPPMNSQFPLANYPPANSYLPPRAPITAYPSYPQPIMHDSMPIINYPPPPPPPMNSQFPASDLPPALSYPPPSVSSSAYPALQRSAPSPAMQDSMQMTSYPRPPSMNSQFPSSDLPPANSYPPPSVSSSAYPALPRSAPLLTPASLMQRALPYSSAPPTVPPLQDAAIVYPALEAQHSNASYYPPPGTRHSEEQSARTPYYPPPGTRYS